MDKRKLVLIFLCIILLFSFAVFVPFMVQQNRFNKLGIEEKKVLYAEIIVYGGKAFDSNILAGKVINDSEIIDIINSQLSMKKICLYNPKVTSTVLFIYFEDGSTLNCFVNGDRVGFNYGEVWIKIDNFSDIIKEIL